MTEIVDRRHEGNTLERHASTIGIAIIIAILMWVGNSILVQGENQGLMRGDLKVMSNEIAHLKDMVKQTSMDRYTATDARKDKSECQMKFDVINSRLLRLERKHHKDIDR